MTHRLAPIPPRGDVRVGDRERSEAADRLAAHAAAGRLGVEELEQRLERAQAAVFARDLTALEADLPTPAGPREWRRPAPPLLGWVGTVCALLAAGALLSIAVGHPVFPPLLIAAFFLWRFGRWTRPIGARR